MAVGIRGCGHCSDGKNLSSLQTDSICSSPPKEIVRPIWAKLFSLSALGQWEITPFLTNGSMCPSPCVTHFWSFSLGFLRLTETRAVLETSAGNYLGGERTLWPNTPCSCKGQAGADPDFATGRTRSRKSLDITPTWSMQTLSPPPSLCPSPRSPRFPSRAWWASHCALSCLEFPAHVSMSHINWILTDWIFVNCCPVSLIILRLHLALCVVVYLITRRAFSQSK